MPGMRAAWYGQWGSARCTRNRPLSDLVWFIALNCVIGEFRCIDSPSRLDRELRLATYALGNQRGEAHGHAQRIQPCSFEVLRQFDGFGERFLIAAVVFDHAEASRQRQMLGPHLAHFG